MSKRPRNPRRASYRRFSKRTRYSRGQTSQFPRWTLYGGIIVIGLIIIILIGINLWQKTSSISPEIAQRQLISTSKRWTNVQTVGMDCLATVCSRRISLGLTLLTEELLEDMIRVELATGTSTHTLEERLTELKND